MILNLAETVEDVATHERLSAVYNVHIDGPQAGQTCAAGASATEKSSMLCEGRKPFISDASRVNLVSTVARQSLSSEDMLQRPRQGSKGSVMWADMMEGSAAVDQHSAPPSIAQSRA